MHVHESLEDVRRMLSEALDILNKSTEDEAESLAREIFLGVLLKDDNTALLMRTDAEIDYAMLAVKAKTAAAAFHGLGIKASFHGSNVQKVVIAAEDGEPSPHPSPPKVCTCALGVAIGIAADDSAALNHTHDCAIQGLNGESTTIEAPT